MGKWISGLIGTANIWLLVGLFAAGSAIGGSAAWTLAVWKTKALHNAELKTLVGSTAAALSQSEQNRQAERKSVLDAIEAAKVDNAATAEDVQNIMAKLGGLNRAIRNIEVQTVILSMGSCNFTPDADGLRIDAWRKATGADVPRATDSTGKADRADDTAPEPAAADFIGRAIARGAGQGGDSRLRDRR